MEQQELLKHIERGRNRLPFAHVGAKGLDQFAILHTGRARRFASPAVQAEIEVATNLIIQGKSPVRYGAHQIDAAARAVRFGAQLDISGTGGGAQATVNAVEEQFVIDARGSAFRHLRRRNRWRRIGHRRHGLPVPLNSVHESAGIVKTIWIQTLLYLAHQPKIVARIAPDGQTCLPFSRAVLNDRRPAMIQCKSLYEGHQLNAPAPRPDLSVYAKFLGRHLPRGLESATIPRDQKFPGTNDPLIEEARWRACGRRHTI